MPPKSKAQARLFRMVASGKKKLPGLSKSQALEYVSGYNTSKLPNKVKKTQKKTKPRYK